MISKLNSAQKIMLLSAVIIAVTAEIFPPWLYKDRHTSQERSAGYHFIFGEKPEIKPYPEMQQIFTIVDSTPIHNFSVNKDYLQIYSQRLSLFFLISGFLLLLSTQRTRLKVLLGSFCILFGSIFIVAILFFSSLHFKFS